jgi:hypothetical protein
VRIEKREPKAHGLGAVACPVVGGDEPRVLPVAVAEEHEVSGEVERIQIDAAIGQELVGQTKRVEAQDLRVSG